MGGADSGIDNVSFHAGAGGIEGIVSVERKISLIDSIESPGGAGLSRIDADHTVLFDKRDAWIVCESKSLLFIHAHGETFDGAIISMAAVTIAAEITREAKCFTVDVGDVVFKHHDVLIG